MAVDLKALLRELHLTDEQVAPHRSVRPGPYEQLLFAHTGRPVNKWTQYPRFYDRVLAPYRGAPVRLLEIGVMYGGSLELWRKYFGPEATIFGVDINPETANRVDPPSQVRIGSQADATFLKGVVEEMGGVDIVIDDGSHRSTDQAKSFSALWPAVQPGGVYIIEDVHTAYWEPWEGGFRRANTAIEFVKQVIDDAHGRYHGEPPICARSRDIGIITVADSILAVEKAEPRPPHGNFWVGDDSLV